MSTTCPPQRDLIPRSTTAQIPLGRDHPLVQAADSLDWEEIQRVAQEIRRAKLKNAAGRHPHLRALLGAVLFMALRKRPYRETEDAIRYYAPARYFCGLTETTWTPDFTTIQDFTALMGEEGIKRLNQYVVGLAVEEKFADPAVVAADTTAQEAAIPHPGEVSLMAGFLKSVCAASTTIGHALKGFVQATAAQFRTATRKAREYRLFAKSKAARGRVVKHMADLVEKINDQLGKQLQAVAERKLTLHKKSLMAKRKLEQLHQTMRILLPQIRYWLRTGTVASQKIISIHIPQLYSIVRGKIGKAVEFGLRWGITRLRGGYLLATVAQDRHELLDNRFVQKAVEDLIALFGKAPRAFAYDRGGYSTKNLRELKALGVRQVALAPRGRTPWPVNQDARKRLVRERAQIEAGIATIKAARYGFNCPPARSEAMMGACGQRAVLGFNLTKLVRELAARKGLVLEG
jgi:hypothetical protein